MSGWGFWEWLTYACIAVAAIVIAVDAALKSSELGFRRITQSKIWGFLPIVLIIISSTTIFLNREGFINNASFKEWPDPYNPEVIYGKEFRNEKVVLDNKKYKNCKFYNVTFVYNGTTAVQMENDEFFGFYLASDNPAVNGAYLLVKSAGFINPNIPMLGLDMSKNNINPLKLK